MRLVASLLGMLVVANSSVALAVGPAVLFFEAGSTRMDARSSALLDTLVLETRALQVPRLIVAGHADRAGSSRHNLDLSRRRAEAVRAELLRRGLSEVQFEIQAFGEERPLIDTADGVAEPQNRRVEVMIACIGAPTPFEYMRC